MSTFVNESLFWNILSFSLGVVVGIYYIVLVQWWRKKRSKGNKRLQSMKG